MRIGYTLTRRGDGLDATLRTLSDALTAEGRRVAGAVQATRRDGERRLTAMALHLLPDGAEVNIAQDLGAGAAGCRLDPGALEGATLEIGRRLDAGADLLVLPRFGEREAEGRGFRDVMARALMADVPVLVGVTPDAREAFDAFAEGLGTRLDATPAALTDWARAALDSG